MADQPLLAGSNVALQQQFAPTPISLTFKDVRYSAPANKKNEAPLEILKGVNGHVDKGQFLSIMGPSGAGEDPPLILH